MGRAIAKPAVLRGSEQEGAHETHSKVGLRLGCKRLQRRALDSKPYLP
jgi:hypothetical protein